MSKSCELLPSEDRDPLLHYCITGATVSRLFTVTHIENCPVIFQLWENASLCASLPMAGRLGASSVTTFAAGRL